MQPGTLIDGKYEIVRPLGEGGFGAVYEAIEMEANRKVAIKLLNHHMLQSDDGRRRFEREAKALSGLQHKNVVAFLGYGVWRQAPYMVMELIEGKLLAQLLAKECPIGAERSLKLMRQVFEGLAAAHAAGIVHRDLKPTNIMVTTDGAGTEQIKLIDFGLAKLIPGDGTALITLTETGMAVGTCAYMAPEQALGNPVDARADIYSAGCIWYQMLSGRLPFEAGNNVEVMHMHLSAEPKPIDAFTVQKPAVGIVVHNCMMKDAANRYQSTVDVIDDIERIAAGEANKVIKFKATPSAVPSGTPAKHQIPRKPFSATPFAVVAMAVAVMGAAVFGIYQARQNDEKDKIEFIDRKVHQAAHTTTDFEKLLEFWKTGAASKLRPKSRVQLFKVLLEREVRGRVQFDEPTRNQLGHELLAALRQAKITQYDDPTLYEMANALDFAYMLDHPQDAQLLPEDKLMGYHRVAQYWIRYGPKVYAPAYSKTELPNPCYDIALRYLKEALNVRLRYPHTRNTVSATELLADLNTMFSSSAVQRFCENVLLEQSDDKDVLDIARCRLADVYRLQGRLNDSVHLLELAATSRDHNIRNDATIDLANLYVVNGKYNEARNLLNSMQHVAPTDREHQLTSLARVALLQQDYTQAYRLAKMAEQQYYMTGPRSRIRQSPRLILIASAQRLGRQDEARALTKELAQKNKELSRHDMVNFDVRFTTGVKGDDILPGWGQSAEQSPSTNES